MLVLFLMFSGTSVLFSVVAMPVHIPTSRVPGFLLFHIFTGFVNIKKIILFNNK